MSLDGVRVLLSGVVLSQPAGGVRRHNAELLPRIAKRLAQRGATLEVIEGTQPIAFDLPDEVIRVPARIPPSPPIIRAALEGRFVRERIREAARDGNPYALFHTAHFPAPKKPGVPYSITVHDLRSLKLEHTPMSRRLFARGLLGKAIENAACVITVSETVRIEITEQFRIDPERVSVVPNAADHFTPLPRDPGADAYLLHVGHLEPRKNLELLIRALAHDPDLPALVLAGAPKGGEDERLSALARELGVEGRVRMTGTFDDSDLPGLYARAACAVLPSRLEGFGIGVLEAQRAEVPLAISDTAALREVAGEETPCFDPDDAGACAAAVRRAITSAQGELRSARERAQRYSWERSAALWTDAWDRALGRVTPPRSR